MGARASSLSSTANYCSKSFTLSGCPKAHEFDVFISFTGKTRRGFTSHLVKDLKQAGLRTFTDDLLSRGESISDTLADRIKSSRSTIIVFSKDYAASRSCLDELLQSFRCKQENGHLIFPIFYKVDPSELRHLSGRTGRYLFLHSKTESFGNNFDSKVALWKTCLVLLSDIAGWHFTMSGAGGSEAALIERIVREVATTLRMKNDVLLTERATKIKIDLKSEQDQPKES